jgi:hypothetical protein
MCEPIKEVLIAVWCIEEFAELYHPGVKTLLLLTGPSA